MAGGPYNIPRNTKGEGKFLYIFSPKALLYTGIALIIGYVLTYPFAKWIFNNGKISFFGTVGIGAIGYVISSFKIPDSNNFEITRKAGGEYIDQIILRYLRFKKKKNKIYTFYTEDKKDEQ